MFVLKELRKEKNITMKKLGEKIGVAESTISLYESGKRQPDNVTLLKIADYFNVSVDYLLGRNNTEKKPVPEDELKIKNVKFIGRDGTVKFKKLTPEMISMLEQLPDSDEDL